MTITFDEYARIQHAIPSEEQRWELSGEGLENFKLVKAERRQPGPDEVAFRTDVNSICFSDVKVINAGLSHPRLVGKDLPGGKVVPGHEISLTIVEVGENLRERISRGERYIVQADLFELGSAVGYDRWGGFCDYGLLDKAVLDYLIPVDPARAGYAEAALVEPWACVEASYARADLGPMDHVVWLSGGAGAMGQMHLVRTFAAKVQGDAPNLEKILLTDISDDRLASVQDRYADFAREANVEFLTLNPRQADFEARLDEIAPEGFDYLVALAPVPEVVAEGLKRVRPYGVVNLFAGLKRGTGPMNMGDIHYDQITVTGNSGSRMADMETVLRKVEGKHLATNTSVYAVTGLEDAAKGVAQVKDGSALNKIVIYPLCRDLPLTPITELPDRIKFPDKVAAKLRKGLWSNEAEKVLLETLVESSD